MKQVGLYLMIAGIASLLLNLVGYELKILMWVDNWGQNAGWAIRLGAIVVGAVMYFAIKQTPEQEPQEEVKEEA
ncbi:hypothetical protein FE810_14080 [Thalassotalea litorea]|uniref:DUF378 domain-containing protein n=1 Tax=Thalassotalea litorea TaxID=2020715 RepID=A0A5R9IDG1_9GAMM|nr:hypothetical protein [Thalassotalea litorea]TLU61635.1 hypothetical protein FE810_14080 [Thalassotalea litorea]